MSKIPSPVTPLGAVGLAVAAYSCWVLADTSLKIAGSSSLPAYEVLALVGMAEVILLLLLGFARRDLSALWPKQPSRQLLRSFLDLGNNYCVVIALRHLPLAMFYILIFFAPMVTTILSAYFLHEHLNWKRVLAIVVGFAGVVLAVDPFAAGRPGNVVGYLACLVCVVCFSINMVWSRVLTQTESPESLTLVSALVMTLAGCLGMLYQVHRPGSGLTLLLGATGFFCIVGSYCFFLALRYAAAATVSQFHYSQLLTGAAIAWLIWREKLTAGMLCGAVLIIGAGAYTAAVSCASEQEVSVRSI